MPKLEAIVDMPFGVGIQTKGSQFDASDQEARILLALGRAKIAEAKVEKALKAEDDAKPAKGYNRRDLKAKE